MNTGWICPALFSQNALGGFPLAICARPFASFTIAPRNWERINADCYFFSQYANRFNSDQRLKNISNNVNMMPFLHNNRSHTCSWRVTILISISCLCQQTSMLTFNFCHPKQFSRAFIADLKEELEKEKESQNAIRKRIEEETKTTGKDICICILMTRGENNPTKRATGGVKAMK